MMHSFEVHIGIIAACIPTLRPGYKWLIQRLSPSRKTSSVHLPLADSPKDEFRQKSKTTIPSGASWARGRQAGLSEGEIWKTTRVDVEHGLSG